MAAVLLSGLIVGSEDIQIEAILTLACYAENGPDLRAMAGTNDPFNIGSLPWSARCGHNFVNPHVCNLPAEFLPEDGVAIAQQASCDVSDFF